MRRISTAHSRKAKQKRQNMVLGIALIIVMFGSVFGMVVGSFGKNSNNVEYNGFEFAYQNGLWFVSHEKGNFVFRYNPTQVEEISSVLNPLENYYSKPLYISSESDEVIAGIYQNLFSQNNIVQRMQKACLDSEECEDNSFPVKNCEDNFIIIREKEVSKIYQQDNCVFIEGKSEDLVALTDEFLFNLLDIR